MHVLVIYSNELYQERANALAQKAKGVFGRVINYTETFVKTLPFYEENLSILQEKRGAGYWLWKPLILLDCFKYLNPEDKVIYLDCGDIFDPWVTKIIDECLEDSDICLTEGSIYGKPASAYTKRDCFVLMGCDEDKYWNSIQIEAGVIVFRPTAFVEEIFKSWLVYCMDRRILTDDPNECGLNNIEGFVDHRHDQSVLNCIAVSQNLKVSPKIRQATDCNKND